LRIRLFFRSTATHPNVFGYSKRSNFDPKLAPMKIALIASEVTPFAKTGGLADVLGTLSVAIQQLGNEVFVIAPAYGSVLRGGFTLRETSMQFSVPVGDRTVPAEILESSIGNRVTVCFIRTDQYFDREFLYSTPTGDYPDNSERFVFLAARRWSCSSTGPRTSFIVMTGKQPWLPFISGLRLLDTAKYHGPKPSSPSTILAFKASSTRPTGPS